MANKDPRPSSDAPSPSSRQALRRRAEVLVRKKAAQPPADLEATSPKETRRTLHELRVHQIELEIQNEELRRTQTELDAVRERYFDLYDLAPVGYCTLGPDGRFVEANLTAATLLGVVRGALVKQPISRFILKADQDIYYLHQKRLFESGEPQSLELRMRKKDGTPFWANLEATIVRDANGATVCRVILSDISARAEAANATREMALQMTESAEHDFLTGLPNRMLLNDRISQAIASAPRKTKHLAVLFLDLDGFKHINDSLGHSTGDRLLQSVAGRLVECVRASDTVSRQGGDEFVVLLSEGAHWVDAAIVARRMLKSVAESHFIDQRDLHITTSIGVSVYPDDGKDAEALVKNADTAMYQAKENGRQGYQFFTPAMNVRAVERQSIEEGLRSALERQEFVLHYQPQIDLRTGAIIGAEALIRWMHPTRGLVSPAPFIPIAEDSGLILAIDNWVIRQACEQARAWLDAGLPAVTMAVNVSAMELRDENFADRLFAALGETGLDPRSLEVELTESVLMKHPEPTVSILQTLRGGGVKVAVDDFGTGYSSLSYLGKFAVDALKIDQSFVGQITPTGDGPNLVAAVIGMARSLKLRVVAEGVETPEQLAFLQAQQCDGAQGFYFSRPLVPHQFAEMLRTGIPASSASLSVRI
jgi:diguanylate cyclase (GGDEF)-like protein/PAS domain S-box-containing protein